MKIILTNLLLLLCSSLYAQQIDFAWAKKNRGTNLDRFASVAIDKSKNLYGAGVFLDTILDTSGSPMLISNGSFDVFVQKLDNTGNVLWTKSFGGGDYDWASTIEIDNVGNLYLTGFYRDTVDFDPGVDTFTLISNGNREIYVLKLDSDGNFIWAKSIGGSGVDAATELKIRSFGQHIYRRYLSSWSRF